MSTFNRIVEIIKKDATLEFRNSAVVSSILLFCFCIVFIVVKSFEELSPRYWAAMVWIMMLFACMNAMVKSFVGDSPGQRIFNFLLYDPIEVIIAKIIFNTFYALIIFVIIYCMMKFFIPTQFQSTLLLVGASFLGIIGISTIFSFVSMITTGYENNASVLMSVLALPLTLPIILTLIKFTTDLQLNLNPNSYVDSLKVLVGIDFLLIGIVCILFKEIWQS